MVYGLSYGLSLILGLVALLVLIYTAEDVVDRLLAIATYYSIPDVVIAMSVVSIGTSLPEIASHVTASVGILSGAFNYEVASATVLGANTGSDIVQQTVVFGLVIVAFSITGTKQYFTFTDKFLKKDFFPIIGTSLMALAVAWDGVVSRLDGLVLVASFIAYMYYLYATKDERLNHASEPSDNIIRDTAFLIVGMVALLLSAHVLLEVTELVVAQTGLGGSIIGVVTLGIASALPEMFTAIEGIRKNASGISLGTLIGSNVTNPLLGYGLGAIISTYWVPRPLVLWDLPMEFFTAIILLVYVLFVSDRKLGWKGGLLLIVAYIGYIIIRFSFFAVD